MEKSKKALSNKRYALSSKLLSLTNCDGHGGGVGAGCSGDGDVERKVAVGYEIADAIIWRGSSNIEWGGVG